MDDGLNASALREAIAATMYQNCIGRSWNAASPIERQLFLTGANQAIGMVMDALERTLAAQTEVVQRH